MQQPSSLSRARTRVVSRSILVTGGLALAVASALHARADTVYLRNGTAIRGEVHERPDGKIEIVHRYGALIVDKSEIARIDSTAAGPGKAVTVDTVLTTDNRTLTGDVTFDDNTSEVIVTNSRFGGETRVPRDLVREILWSDRNKKRRAAAAAQNPQGQQAEASEPQDTEAKWKAQIDASLAKIRDPKSDARDRTRARKELLNLGIYATNYVKDQIAAVGSNDPALTPLTDVLRVAQLKTVVSSAVEAQYPDMCEQLIDPDPEKRMAALKNIFFFHDEDAPPLLLHMIHHDASAKVKGLCVGELAFLKRYEDLGNVLKMHGENGQLRFAAAIALGEAGIYAGIPVIIEALKLESKEVRSAAIDALKKYTGQGDLGFLPEGDAESRNVAVKRWEDWWAAEGSAVVKKSLRSWDKGEITDADKTKAIDKWREGNKTLEELEKKGTPDEKGRSYSFELAAHFFKEATDLDPTLCSARLSRALVLYERLGRPQEAEGELKLILSRYAPEDAALPRLLATYHLGRIYELEGDYKRAEARYLEAGRFDDTFFDAFIGAGDCALERALAVKPGTTNETEVAVAPIPAGSPRPDSDVPRPPTPEKQTREELIIRSVLAYRRAITAIDRKVNGLKNSARDLGGLTGESENFGEGRLLVTIKHTREELTKHAADVWFRLGRAESARGNMTEALASYRAARALDPDPRYSQAVAFWENALEPNKQTDASKQPEPVKQPEAKPIEANKLLEPKPDAPQPAPSGPPDK